MHSRTETIKKPSHFVDSQTQIYDGAQNGDHATLTNTYHGAHIAGEYAQLREFTPEDYAQALADGKTVLLYFYASWCPTCRAEFTEAINAFRSLDDDSIIGFRVHYKDGSDTHEMRELARSFGVAYQHTKVIVRGDTLLRKSAETWNSQRYIRELKVYTQ